MRPAMGGPGIQPQPQRQQQGAMGILMPLYTVGIVVFFVYTIMKVKSRTTILNFVHAFVTMKLL